ncbi:MAG: tetratricopeptide repeat protein [bacterium]
MTEEKENNSEFGAKYHKLLQSLRPKSHNECPESEQLLRYFKKELDGEQQRLLEEHIDLCPVCIEVLHRLEDTANIADEEVELPENWRGIETKLDERVYSHLDSFRESERHHVTEASNHLSLFGKLKAISNDRFLQILKTPRLAYAGAVIALCIGFLYGYAFTLRPEYFAIAQIQPEKRSILRSKAIQSESLRKGVEFFYQEKYERAIVDLSAYLEGEPNHYQANYHLGLAYVLDAEIWLLGLPYDFDTSKVRQGISYFEKALSLARDNAFYQEDCFWYLGKAYLMMGDLDKAREQFEQLLQLSQPNLMRKDEARKIVLKINELSRNL